MLLLRLCNQLLREEHLAVLDRIDLRHLLPVLEHYVSLSLRSSSPQAHNLVLVGAEKENYVFTIEIQGLFVGSLDKAELPLQLLEKGFEIARLSAERNQELLTDVVVIEVLDLNNRVGYIQT